MTKAQFFRKLMWGFKLPFSINDVIELDSKTGMITLRNDEHPYIIRIDKLPIESDYDDEKKVNILSGTKNNQS